MSYARYYRFFATLTLVVGLVLTNVVSQFRPLSITRLALQAKAKAESVTNAIPNPSSFKSDEEKRVLAAASERPVSFEPNMGQTDSQVKFLSRSGGGMLFLTPSETVLSLSRGTQRKGRNNRITDRVDEAPAESRAVLRMHLMNANRSPQVEGVEPLSSYSNYFFGSDPSKWQTKVPHFAKVRYSDVYPGVDLVYYGNQQQLEYDFILEPGADPRAIKMSFEGAQKLSLDDDGNLVIAVPGGELRHHKPVIYQEINGSKLVVAGQFLLKGKRQVGFEVGQYDPSRNLIIDPSISYSSYLGGSSDDYANGVSGPYVVGTTNSSNFPTRGGSIHDGLHNGGKDVFVAYFDPSVSGNNSLVWATYAGGSGTDEGQGIALETNGIYITGFTNSNDSGTPFPTSDTAVQPDNGGSYDAFAMLLTTSGALSYSTYHGGSSDDKAYGIAVDEFDKAYITGYTQSTSATFPLVLNYQGSRSGLQDAFVTKFNTTGSGRDYSTYVGGNSSETAYAIALDGSVAVITGVTTSTDSAGSNTFPATSGAYDTSNAGNGDVFVTKVALISSSYGPTYSTLLGGDGGELGLGIKATSSNVFVTGYTTTDVGTATSTSWPANTGSYNTSINSATDAFVTKLNSTLSTLSWSTYIGGTDDDVASALDIDSSDNVYITGWTYSTDFPTTSAFQGSHGGGASESDAFVTKINSNGTSLSFSSFLGGDGEDYGNGISVGSGATYTYVVGQTYASDFPLSANPHDGGLTGTTDAFFTRITN
jgi:hypothetical protein